MFLVELAT